MSKHSSDHSYPHVLPLKTYLSVFGFLILMTGITVFVGTFNLGELNIIVAMAIAAAKAIAVAAIFMHLKYDNKLYMLAFIVSLLCLGTFITLTLVDTDYRGKVDEATTHPIVPQVVLPNAGKTPEHEEGGAHEAATPAVTDSSAAHAKQPGTPAPTDTSHPPPGH